MSKKTECFHEWFHGGFIVGFKVQPDFTTKCRSKDGFIAGFIDGFITGFIAVFLGGFIAAPSNVASGRWFHSGFIIIFYYPVSYPVS